MKKITIVALTFLSLIGIVLVVGCSDETTIGDTTDPQFETFTELFDNVNQATGEMIGTPFMFIDTIAAQGGNAAPAMFKPGSAEAVSITLTWIAATNFWYCTAEVTETDVTLMFTDSIQFRHGTTPVQYFNDDSLTQIVSYASLSASGVNIDTAWGRQMQMIAYDRQTSILTFTGTGATGATLTEDSCTITWNYTQAFSNLSWYADYLFDEQSDELNCPYQGSIAHTGSLSGSCGDGGTSINGNWGVTATFDDGTISYQVNNGGTQWTSSEECSTGFTSDLSMGDTLFVEDMFGDGAMEQFLEGIDVGLALMVDQGKMEPMNAPAKTHLGTTALSDTVIVSTISSYTYTNGWHIFTFSARTVDYQDTVVVEGIDSIRFVQDGQPLDSVPDLFAIDTLVSRPHVALDAVGSEGLVSGRMNHDMTAVVNAGGTDTTVTFYGFVNDTVLVVSSNGLTGTCEVELTLNQTVNSLVMNPAANGECPFSGQVISDFGVDLACNSNDGINSLIISGGWTVTAVANGDDTITVTYVNDAGTVSWSRTGDCMGSNQSAMALHRHQD